MMTYREQRELDEGFIRRGGRRFCWHRWDLDDVMGVWRYRECAKCERREAIRLYSNLGGPVDLHWVNTGQWSGPPDPPPPPEPFRRVRVPYA